MLAVLAVCAGARSAFAAAKDFAGPGNFSDATKWTGGTLPKTGDNLTIEGGACVFDDAAQNLEYGSIQVGFKTVASIVWPAGGTNMLHVTGIIKSNAGGTIDMSNGGTLRVGSGGWTTTGYTFVPGTGTVEWDNTSGNATISPTLTTFNNMTVLATGRILSLGGGVTFTGNLTLEAGTLDVSGVIYPVTVKGNWINNGGTFLPRTGTVTLNGSAAQSIGGSVSTAFNNLTIANTAATVSCDTSADVSGTLDVSAGAIFSPAAAVVLNSGAAAGAVTGAGTLRVTRTAATPDLVNQYRFATYTLSGLTVDYTGAGAQTVNSTVGSYGALVLSGSGTKTLEGAVTDNGTLTSAAGVTLADAGFTLTVKGHVSHAGTHSGAGKILLAGTLPQTLSGAGSYHNLEVNNAGGVSLNNAVPVNGALTLTAGLLTTGAHAVQLAETATATRAGGWVNGYVQKAFHTGAGQTFTFPIGGSANYRPAAVSNLSVTTAGTLTAYVTASAGNHPQIATSGLNPSKTVLRYWTLTAGGGLAVANYDATFTFIPSDVSPGADTGRFDVRKWDGGAWAETDDGVPPTATTTTATGLSSFSDFVMGEEQASLMVVTLPGQSFTNGVGNSGAAIAQTAGAPFTLTLRAIGTFTNVDTSYSGLKTIRLSGPTNAPNGSWPVYTYSAEFVNGQASLTSIALLKAETVALSATDDLLTPVPSAPLTVAPAAASRLAFLNEPVTTPAGSASASLTVQRQDAYGNPNTADAARSVTLSSDSSGAVTFTPASPVSITSGASSVNFTYTDTKAGKPTVTAASSSPAMSAAQQQTVLAGPVSATTSTFTASPSSVTADGVTTSTLTVTLKDAYGNPVPDKSVSAVKKTGAGSPVITAVKNITGADGQGIGTVKSTTAATNVFEVRDTTDDIVISQQASVTFTAGAVHHYKVSFSQAPYYALTPFTTRITAHDVYDNFVAAEAGAIFTISSSSPNTVWDGHGDNTFSTDLEDITATTANGTATIPTKCLNPDGAQGVILTASNTVTHLTYASSPIDINVQTDAYRTRASGLWSDASTWERYDSSAGVTNWVAATFAPAYTNGVISILPEHAVTVAGDVLVDQLHIEQGGLLAVAGGVALTATNASMPGVEVYGALVNTGALNVAACSNSVVIVYDSGVLGNAGSISSCSNALVFYGGTYQHLHRATAGAIPSAAWRQNSQPSTCAILGYTSNTGTPDGLNQSFQQFIWNCPDQTGAISLGTGFVGVVSFDISSTGTGRVSLASPLGVTNTVTVSGNASLYCGTNVVTANRFDLNPGCTLGIGSPDGITTNGATGNIRSLTSRFSSGANYVYNGSAAQTAGDALPSRVHSLKVDNAAGVTLSQDVKVNDLLTLENGALAIGGHALTLENKLAKVNGSLAGGVSSSLHITDAGGAANLALPAVADGLQSLTLARDSGATLTGAVTVWKTLMLTNGVLSSCGYLTLANECHFIRGTGSFYGPGAPTLLGLLDVTFLSGDLTAGLSFPPAVSNLIRNVTLANTTGTILLNYDFILQGNLTVNAGSRFNDSGHTVTVHGSMTNSGTYVSSGGRLILAGGTNLHVIAGSGTYDNLELDDPLGATLADPITVNTRLTLTAGTLANSGNLTLGSGAEVRRAAGALSAAPTFGSSVNVTYFGTAGVTTGYELPSNASLLQDLTLEHTAAATVTLSASSTVNNDLTIGSLSLLADGGYTLKVVGDVYNSGIHSGAGKISLDNLSSQVLFGNGTYGNLELLRGDLDLAGDPTINGTLTTSGGKFKVGAHTLTLNGPPIQVASTNLATTLDSSLVFGGSASGVVIPSSVALLNNLTVNNPNGVTLENTLRTVGTLTLASGTLNTGTNILHHDNLNNGSVVRTQGWVNGGLCKLFDVGAGQAFTFPVGGAAAYRPVVWSHMDVLSGGEMEMVSVEGVPALIAGSGLDSNRVAKAYWRGYAKGRYKMANGVGAFTVASGDVPSGADINRFNLRVWASQVQTWLDVTVDARTASAVVGSDLYSVAQPSETRLEYGEFVVGESLASQLLVTLPGETYTNTVSQGNFNFGTAGSQIAGQSFNLELRAVDQFNAVDPSYSGVKAISTTGPANAPNGAGPVYTTEVTFTDGRATGVATTLKRAETTALTASDGLLTGVPSSALTVNAAPASRLTFASAPATVNVGFFSEPLEVRRLDAYDNPNTNDAALTLSLSSTTGGTPVFSPASPKIEAGAGSVAFQYKDTQAGTWTLKAEGGSLTAAEQTVTVVDAAELVWDGGGADNNALTAGNWLGDVAPREGDKLVFAGSVRLAVTNDAPAYSAIGGLSFTNGVGAFVLEWAVFGLAGNVVDASTVPQTINLPFFIVSHSAFDVAAAGLLVVNREISGDYALTKAGAGTLNLTAANFYSGGTVVTGGTLRVNNTQGSGTGSGDVTVNSGGTLGGSGFISGAVTIQAGGTLAPGNSPGTITFYTNLTLEAGSTFAVEIAGSSNDLAVVEGTATLGGATLSITGSAPTTNLFTIISAGSVTGTFADLPEGASVLIDGKLYFIHYGATEVTLNASARLTGYVFRDKGALDGIFNSGDSAVSTALVRLFTNDVEAASYTTGYDGYYEFSGLQAGAATLKIALDSGTLTPGDGGSDPMRNQAVVSGSDAVITTTVVSGAGVLSTPDTLNFGFDVKPLSTALDIGLYATADGVVIELWTVDESGYDDIVIYAWINEAWVEVGRVPSAEVLGEGCNRYQVRASGLAADGVYAFKILDEAGHVHVTAAPVAVQSIQVAAVRLELETLTLTFNTEYGYAYTVETSADLVNWTPETVSVSRGTGWTVYGNTAFAAGAGSETVVRVPRQAREKAFFRIVRSD